MFRASLCPSSEDRLYKTASGVNLDLLAAECVESGHEDTVRSARVLTPNNPQPAHPG